MRVLAIHILLILGTFQTIAQIPVPADSPVQLHLIFKTTDSLQVKPRRKPVADSLISYARTYLGDRYRRGGTGGRGFDCSGYTMMVFRRFGIKLPHTSAGQSFMGVEIPLRQAGKGDLIFFRGRNSRRRGIGHVGIIISNKGEPVQFIHSATSHGVRIDALQAPYYKRRFMKVTRVLPLN